MRILGFLAAVIAGAAASARCSCPSVVDPVCGTNGVTYMSECLLYCARMPGSPNIQVASRGPCDANSIAYICPDTCPLVFDPVCGSDGNDYASRCLLEVANCKSTHAGSENITIAQEGFCPRLDTVVPDCNATLKCADGFPVCGSDGYTYHSYCALQETSCANPENAPTIYLKHRGECEPQPINCEIMMKCGDISPPVCGSDGVTYAHICDLHNTVCNNATLTNVTVAYMGPCVAKTCDLACPEIYMPLCSKDNITHPSQCVVDVQNCLRASVGLPLIEIEHAGECNETSNVNATNPCDKPCTMDYNPVCGSDNVTYPNECARSIAECRAVAAALEPIVMVYPGDCADLYNPRPIEDKEVVNVRAAVGDASLADDSSDIVVTDVGHFPVDPIWVFECAAGCPNVFSPVCGNNSITYINTCYMFRANCYSGTNTTAEVAYSGVCYNVTPSTIYPTQCNPLTDVNASFCGTDSVTYTSFGIMSEAARRSFLFNYTGIAIAYAGNCSNTTNATELKLDPCPVAFIPVCGTDNVTYPNECMLQQATQINKTIIGVASEGPCPYVASPNVSFDCTLVGSLRCADVNETVCGSDGVTYTNLCELQIANCITETPIVVRSEGACPAKRTPELPKCPYYCTREYAPVCASDGKTYDTECTMRMAVCETEQTLTVLHKGVCTAKCSKVCPTIFKPVCGSDGSTYPSECEMGAVACRTGHSITVKHEGECKSREEVTPLVRCARACPRTYMPVCGSDKVTYSNQCLLDMASCKSGGSITLVSTGPCIEPSQITSKNPAKRVIPVTASAPKLVLCNAAADCSKRIGGKANQWVCDTRRKCGYTGCTVDGHYSLKCQSVCRAKRSIKNVNVGYCRKVTA